MKSPAPKRVIPAMIPRFNPGENPKQCLRNFFRVLGSGSRFAPACAKPKLRFGKRVGRDDTLWFYLSERALIATRQLRACPFCASPRDLTPLPHPPSGDDAPGQFGDDEQENAPWRIESTFEMRKFVPAIFLASVWNAGSFVARGRHIDGAQRATNSSAGSPYRTNPRKL